MKNTLMIQLSGWKRAGFYNSVAMILLSLCLMSCLIVATTKSGSLGTSWLFFIGDCSKTARLNVALHFLLNVVSTMILASSNFFMQIINAPSVNDIRAAHNKFAWFDIGVPSPRNLIRLPWRKTALWVLLVLSSLPIHLVANSTIFSTNFGANNYFGAIAAEPFLQSAPYYLPGGSLTIVAPHSLSDYDDPAKEMPVAIQELRDQASAWERLEPPRCRSIYFSGQPLRAYGDMLMIARVRGDIKTDGWVRSKVWNLTARFEFRHPEEYDKYVPPEALNSLWWAERCPVAVGQDNYCWITNLKDSIGNQKGNVFNISWYDIHSGNAESYYLDKRYNDLDVDYCLAEPKQAVCKVGLSNILLLAVTLCTIVKAVLSILVFSFLGREHLLATPGDAVEYFISHPEPLTIGLCTYGHLDIKRLASTDSPILAQRRAQPRTWADRSRHWREAVSVVSQLLTFGLISIVLGFTGFLYHQGHRYATGKDNTSRNGGKESFGPSVMNDYIGLNWFPQGHLISSVLLANLPQLILSICYILYNALMTRMLMAYEWAQFSTGYRPLRVTDPKGEQISSYRLQIPYKYGIPLLIMSAILHWLFPTAYIVSSGKAIGHVTDAQKDYFDYIKLHGSSEAGLQSAFVGVGYSPPAILAVLIVGSVLVIIPIALGFRKLPGSMLMVGCNSLAISAACHVYAQNVEGNNEDVGERGNGRSQQENVVTSWLEKTPEQQLLVREGSGCSSLLTLTRKKLKWGVVDGADRAHSIRDNDEVPGRLSFGSVKDDVGEPIDGKLYA